MRKVLTTDEARTKERDRLRLYRSSEKGRAYYTSDHYKVLRLGQVKRFMNRLRTRAYGQYPNHCASCGGQVNQLHHLTYSHPREYYVGRSAEIWKEALKQPSNFVQLCKRCHYLVTLLTHTSETTQKAVIVIASQTKLGF